MFTFKKATALKCIAVATFLAMAGCGKNDNNVTPEPETPKDRYLIKTVVYVPIMDSLDFQYNNKYQLTRIRVSIGNQAGSIGNKMMTYDNNGRLTYTVESRTDSLIPVVYDSTVWLGNNATFYRRYLTKAATANDTSRYEYNSAGQPISMIRPLRSEEYIYQNGDLMELRTTTSYGTPVKLITTYEYDTMPNPFYEMYLNNTYVNLHSVTSPYPILPSKHNVTKITTNRSANGGPFYSFVELYENKYNPTTHLLEEQIHKSITSPGDTARSTTVFTYIKMQ